MQELNAGADEYDTADGARREQTMAFSALTMAPPEKTGGDEYDSVDGPAMPFAALTVAPAEDVYEDFSQHVRPRYADFSQHVRARGDKKGGRFEHYDEPMSDENTRDVPVYDVAE